MTISGEAIAKQGVAAKGASATSKAPEAKVVIRDSGGDDVLIIAGNHAGELIDADLGTGNDLIVRTEKDYAFPSNAPGTGLTWAGIALLAALALVLCGVIVFAFRRHAR